MGGGEARRGGARIEIQGVLSIKIFFIESVELR